MSSNTYSACLSPDPWLRLIVLTSGRLLAAAGFAMILSMHVPAGLRFMICLAWSLLIWRELRDLKDSFDRIGGIRVHWDGTAGLLGRDRECIAAALAGGSIVLENIAWLRLRCDDGRVHTELLRGDARESAQWRRLQVIIRHIGATG